MEFEIFVARVAALVYLSVGIGFLLDGTYSRKLMNDMMNDSSALYLGGFMALVAGFTIVTYHNVWEQSWVVLVTLLGWLALVKGVMLLAMPTTFVGLTKTMTKNADKYSWAAIVLGAIFGYYGFLA